MKLCSNQSKLTIGHIKFDKAGHTDNYFNTSKLIHKLECQSEKINSQQKDKKHNANYIKISVDHKRQETQSHFQ